VVPHKTFILGDGRAWSFIRRLLSKASLKRHEFKSGDKFFSSLNKQNLKPCVKQNIQMNIWSEYKKKVIGLRKFLLRNVTNTTGDPIE